MLKYFLFVKGWGGRGREGTQKMKGKKLAPDRMRIGNR